jgi:hypothetical protein
MPAWCLTKQAKEKLVKALQADGDPRKMAERTSEERLQWFTDQVGRENALHLNEVFESKMLLQSQVRGFQSFVKSMGGSRVVQRDFLSKVERLNKALSKKEVDQYLESYVEKRLGIEPVNEAQFKVISNLSEKIEGLKKEFDPTTNTWKSEGSANMKGALQVELENFTQELTDGKTIRQIFEDRKTQFKEEYSKNPTRAVGSMLLDSAKGIANSSIEIVASFDDSLFGRQGIFNLLSGHPRIWGKNFVKSFDDIRKELGGQRTADSLLASVYADPLYMNGEMRKAGIIDMIEEQYPAGWLEKISASRGKGAGQLIGTPLWAFGRGIKASAAAFKNGSLRMRMELYKVMRQAKVDRGIELTDDEIKGMGAVVNSLSARGHLGRSGANPVVRLLMWAPRMLKADLDVLTAHSFSDIPKSDRRAARINLANIVAATVLINGAFYLHNKKDVELDPRSSDFLKIGGSFGYLRGVPQIITLMTRMLSGQYKTATGEVKDYAPGIGNRSRLDAIYSFLRGKAPPATAGVYDFLAGQDYAGNPPTFTSVLFQHGVPISIQNLVKLRANPSVDQAFGVIADFFGLNATLNPEPNAKSGIIPEGQKVKNEDLISVVKTYAEAMGTDPETAFNRMFSGQKIRKVSNGTIIVERMSLADSQAVKKKSNADNPTMKLDHTVPLELGGSNDESNLKLVSTSTWSSYTKVENALGQALTDGKISKQDAQKEIQKFKSIQDSAARKRYGQTLINKYK